MEGFSDQVIMDTCRLILRGSTRWEVYYYRLTAVSVIGNGKNVTSF